jgi:hypothetical protein
MKKHIGILFVVLKCAWEFNVEINCKEVVYSCMWVAPYIQYCIQHRVFVATTTIATTCPLTSRLYKYHELQVSIATRKCNCKPNCKTLYFLIVKVTEYDNLLKQITNSTINVFFVLQVNKGNNCKKVQKFKLDVRHIFN